MKKKISKDIDKLKDQTKEIYNKYIKISLIILAIVFYIKIIFLYWYADLRGTEDYMQYLKALLWPFVVLISEIIRAYKKLISMYKKVLESVTWLQWLRKLLMKIPKLLCLKIIPNN